MAKKRGVSNILDYVVINPKQSIVGVLIVGAGVYFGYRAYKNYKNKQQETSEKNPYNWGKYIPIIQKKYSKDKLALYTATQYNVLAEQIYDALGLTDSYDEVKAVYNKISNKYSFSFLAKAFEEKYKKDLRTWLTDGYYWNPAGGFKDEQIEKLQEYIDSLPDVIKVIK
jgi:hypothetical protein